MNPAARPTVVTAVLMAFCCGIVACKPTLPPEGPIGDAVAAVNEIEDDATQDTTTAADSTATPPDADGQPDTMALDTMALDGVAIDAAQDVVQDTALPPGPACEVSATKAPVPGTPCTTKGEVRCSDVGRYSAPNNLVFHDKLDPFCIRPNIVRCTSIGGKLEWTGEACPQPAGPPGCKVAKLPVTCSESASGASCCPAGCVKDGVPLPNAGYVSPYSLAFRCSSDWAGKSVCLPGLARRYTCTTPSGTLAVKDFNEKYFHTCAQWCAGCTYWFTSEVCGELKCKKSKDQKPPCTPDTWEKMCSEHGGLPPSWDWPPYPAACKAQPDNNGPCQKTCEELGLFTP